MITTAISCALRGLTGLPVCVEADISSGLPGLTIVGLTDRAIQEARERVKAAVRNSGFKWPSRKTIVNLAPAEIPKEGTGFDLAIAIAILTAAGHRVDLTSTALVGELALDGALRPVAGVLPMARALAAAGFTRLVTPAANAGEAALVDGLRVFGAASLRDCMNHLEGSTLLAVAQPEAPTAPPRCAVDLGDVRGQATAKRALEVAAAGGHNLLMLGPPGSGKTMLARCLPALLPDLSHEDCLDVAAIYSLRGAYRERAATDSRPPFRAPHHSVSRAGLVGGGSGVAQPGEISLAHRGVLCLDEFCEFPRSHLEALRQPLEERAVTIARARGTVSYPASFTLIAASNPCPCGFAGDTSTPCTCEPQALTRYRARMSGPIHDRIDMFVDVPRQRWKTVFGTTERPEGSDAVRSRVEGARLRQRERGRALNAELEGRHLRSVCQLDVHAEKLLASAGERMQLSARGFHRVLRVARTIGDLAGAPTVGVDELGEALRYRAGSDAAT